ncbi:MULTISPECIES: helix-turn-helix transcriptional regulator [Vibrio]|uniref:AraC family transcriptional regulator n=1 Tax=Vibrio kanaloae TaxID=170673 RepID=A0A2N7JBR7_9VIBR|nr:AraC family transcriptional regulator [Vibrio kanaloae]KAB0457919.1 AraC family transcriptional regulator [Vibrio kanaloae]MCG9558868.1 AraC family transcriptional regulator [Vibrio kanaloae]NOI03235.1 AraC family transcriptional regulator [Vibrio kanaloae]NOJ01782.1 AraC family transcriptional regulator [Vibrio kanaloae]OEF10972.1 AraC family transcriptional regulator [Vibrio kanaloae 5S-149]
MDKVHYYSTPSQDISLIRAQYQEFAFQRHYHLDFHIGLITQGQQKFVYKGTSYHAGAGQVVMMPPDELHDGHSELESGYQVSVFSVSPQWLSDLADQREHGHTLSFSELILSDQATFLQLCNLHALLINQNISQLAQDCLPYEGFSTIVDRYVKFGSKSQVQLGIQSIHTLKEYLMANLDQPVRLEQLSDLCDLTTTQFQRHFKNKMGITPYAWLSRLRMEQGMRLIKSGVSGTEVAHQVGFYDQAHFSKAFKTAFGVSPSKIN